MFAQKSFISRLRYRLFSQPYAPSQIHKSAESSTLPQSVRYPLPLTPHSDFASWSLWSTVPRTKVFCWTPTSLPILLADVRASGLPFATESQNQVSTEEMRPTDSSWKDKKQKRKRGKRSRMNSRIRTPPLYILRWKCRLQDHKKNSRGFFVSTYAVKRRLSHNLNILWVRYR